MGSTGGAIAKLGDGIGLARRWTHGNARLDSSGRVANEIIEVGAFAAKTAVNRQHGDAMNDRPNESRHVRRLLVADETVGLEGDDCVDEDLKRAGSLLLKLG